MRLVIGYGSTLRRDDGIGWAAAALLAAQGQPDDVQILTCHQLTPELIESIRLAALVIFVDASDMGSPGEIACQVVEPDGVPASIAHASTPPLLLAAARDLYGAQPIGFLVSLNGVDFGFGEELTPQTLARLPDLVRLVERLLAFYAPDPPLK
jgi:hydrogenase maturation protease